MRAVKVFLIFLMAPVPGAGGEVASGGVTASAGASIQQALDANPGTVVFVPSGDYEISEPIRIVTDNAGLSGPGRIIQTDPNQSIVVASDAQNVRIEDVTLTRKSGQTATISGLVANSCDDLLIDNVRVLDNCSTASAVNINRCRNGRLSGCLVRNYTAIGVDDRTANENYGFAFRCIDGTGVQFTYCNSMLVQNNRIIEEINRPTPEIRDKFKLGGFVKKNAQRGPLVGEASWETETFPAWHQGSALYVGGPTSASNIQILGNTIENAAQGIDIHADKVTVAQNIVTNAGVGMKAMHGSRNILILGNQFDKCTHWAIGLQPGASSHGPRPAENEAEGAGGSISNVDGGTIIAHNMITDFGYGDAYWMWGNERSPISLEHGQTPQNPPLRDVIVDGNIVYDPGREQHAADGNDQATAPRYRYAVLVTPDSGDLKGPVGVRFSNNLLHPGSLGVSNVSLDP